MKILAIGSFYEHESVDCVSFGSTISFLDYDIVVIDFQYILSDYKASSSGTYRGYKCLNDDDSVKLLQDIERRRLEIIEMLKLGRSIVVYTPCDQICYVDTGRREYSGTGKNRHTTRIVQDINLLSVLPVSFNTIQASGSSIEFKGEELFSAFWNKNKKYLSFNAYFKETVGKPLFYIKGTDKVIGSYLNVENGSLLFIPAFSDENEEEKNEREFFKSIIVVINELKKSTGDFELPDWALNYLLPDELKQRDVLSKYEKDLKSISNKISKQKKLISMIEENKILFTGTGKALEIHVGKIFSNLGFEVAEGLPGRDDLILKFGGKVAVVEVKGVSKSAAEKHAAQLEKWVSEYYSSHELLPKGILIVNAFKDIPLKDRIEDAFPSQMKSYCENRNHCLLTGIQLLGLYLFCNQNKDKIAETVDKLFDTNGEHEDFNDWTSYITANSEVNSEEVKKD